MPFAEAVARVERWLLPAECLLCRERTNTDDLICRVCQARWRPIPHPRCHRCGQPEERNQACSICADWPPGLASAESAVWLDESARRAVHALKYQGWWRAADAMAASVARLEAVRTGEVLVPVPLGAARAKIRGYNQSAKLAHAVARRAHRVVDDAVLVRMRETASQTTLTPDQRAANLVGAFAVRGRVRERIVLVDDVFTTGATLASAAQALLHHGAVEVRAVTFARAELPLAGVARTV